MGSQFYRCSHSQVGRYGTQLLQRVTTYHPGSQDLRFCDQKVSKLRVRKYLLQNLCIHKSSRLSIDRAHRQQSDVHQ
jgi:hypothetical protein